MSRKCLTPGASFTCFALKPNSGCQPSVRFMVTVPLNVVLTEARVKKLEKAFHDAIEETMAPWWPQP